MFVRSGFPFNYDTVEASNASGLSCEGDPGKAQQSFAEECDINTIVRRFGLTGQLPVNVRMPEYADFENAVDFQTAMNAIVSARESFEAMPADVRYRFHNDPQEFLEFCANAENRAEAIKLGLVPAAELAADAAGASSSPAAAATAAPAAPAP